MLAVRGTSRQLVAGIASATLVVTLAAASSTSAESAPNHDKVVGAVPAANTPAVLDRSVRTIAQVGDSMVLGGNFTRARSDGSNSEITRRYLLSFDPDTGQISTSFTPSLNGSVEAVAPGPSPNTVYVAGGFSQVNGANTSRVVLLNLSNGSRVTSFDAPPMNGRVNAIKRVGGRLYVGGNFKNVGGDFYGGLVALDADTGARQSYLNTPVTERHNNTGGGAQGAVGVRGLDVTPDGDRMVIIGNFRKVDGQSRVQAAVLDLGSSAGTVSSWRTRRYEPYCFNWAFDTYVRGVSMSPDGSYFVIASTGGHNAGTLCDTAARFETSASGDGIQPTWVADTGGDTLWAVETTEEAVYVGGHQRWFNNARGSDRAEAGAVARPGIAALDPRTGIPLEWNPGRNPRGSAVYALHATSDGLWMGSDTQWIGNRQYRRPRIAFFPLADGEPVVNDAKPTLPGTVYLGGSNGDDLRTVEFDGTTADSAVPADPGNVDWDRVRGAFRAGDSLFYGQSDGALYRRTFDDGTFGPETQLDPYHDPYWDGVDTGSGNTYDGRTSAFYSQIRDVTGMYYDDGRLFYTLRGRSSLYYRFFSPDSGIVGVDQFEASTGRNWSDTEGMFAAGDKVYVASSNGGALRAVTVQNGIPSGAAAVVDTGNDWRSNALFLGGAPPQPNTPPAAAFSAECPDLTCEFDAGGSSDGDGQIVSYEWDFGDGSSGSGEVAQHEYADGGRQDVTLTVTDDEGASDSVTHEVSPLPPGVSDLAYRGSTSRAHDNGNPHIAVPSQAQAGDLLITVATFARETPNPVAPSGWSLLDSETDGNVSTFAWTKTATASDAGSATSWDIDGSPKSTLTMAAYGGTDAASPISAHAVATQRYTATHTTPASSAGSGDWVLSYWADRSSNTTAWSVPGSVSLREEAFGAGGGRITSAFADSGGPVAAGPVGDLEATTPTSSPRSLTWTIVLY